MSESPLLAGVDLIPLTGQGVDEAAEVGTDVLRSRPCVLAPDGASPTRCLDWS